MKKSLDEHAERFSNHADSYDENQDSAAYRACVDFVVDHASPDQDDVVLDLGTGTGAIAFALAPDAREVVGRDISDGMLAEAREKAADKGFDNVTFDEGRFRDPNVDRPVDIVTSNFAMHHLGDAEKRDSIDTITELDPRRIVLGDVMLFGDDDPDAPFYSPEVDDPATVGVLADAFTDAGYALTAVEMITDQAGVLVAEPVEEN
ncbi:MAG: class I SAM-dependent methyltransferase [Haloarcula sp.]